MFHHFVNIFGFSSFYGKDLVLNWNQSFFRFACFPHGWRLYLVWCTFGFISLTVATFLDGMYYVIDVETKKLTKPHDSDPIPWYVNGLNVVSLLGCLYFLLVLFNWLIYSRTVVNESIPFPLLLQWMIHTLLGPYSFLSLLCFELYFVNDITTHDTARAKTILLFLFMFPITYFGSFPHKPEHVLFSTGLVCLHFFTVISASFIDGIHIYYLIDMQKQPKESILFTLKIIFINVCVHLFIVTWNTWKNIHWLRVPIYQKSVKSENVC